MRGKEYQKLAMRTNDGKSSERLTRFLDEHDWSREDIGGILNGCLGLAGEAGETLDMVKKWIFHEQSLDVAHIEKEIGDVMWYVAMLCESFGFNLDEIMLMNINKLRARYPEGFDTDRSNNRDENDV